jgi:acyl-CoA hydrolase
MPSIADTRQELLQLVLPEHANVLGGLFGGRMMDWITQAATLPALRLARGPVVLGSMDDLDFLSPVRVGDLVILRAQVEYIGRSSMEIAIEVDAEQPRSGDRRRATSAHVAMVAVDDAGRPRPVRAVIEPATPAEQEAAAAGRARKEARDRRLAAHRPEAIAGADREDQPRHAVELPRLVFPDDAFAGNMMSAGRLLLAVDEVASIAAVRYARGPVVTAAIDGLDFYAPIRVGNIVTYQAAINFVGRTSLEVGVRVLAEDARTGATHHTCTAYLTVVHVGLDGRPRPLPPLVPHTPAERRRWEAAEARRAARTRRRAAQGP